MTLKGPQEPVAGIVGPVEDGVAQLGLLDNAMMWNEGNDTEGWIAPKKERDDLRTPQRTHRGR
ncbi:hypothetical protein VM1G_12028 [Cytospora mali]|uniref:Uncharacterized protein n=1 Tax=Cytospora mali TaxID=578113 RepID=A0A194VIZ0_CYTMA|nr:hypothetical protein VM1G_12028 [Valsa mali]